MEAFENQKEVQNLLSTLCKNSWKNEEFKNKLISNPIETIESITGRESKLPQKMSIIVEDQSNTSYIYLNIPAKPNYQNLELTDEQLEVVAGGEVVATAAIFTAVGLGALGAGYAVGKYVL